MRYIITAAAGITVVRRWFVPRKNFEQGTDLVFFAPQEDFQYGLDSVVSIRGDVGRKLPKSLRLISLLPLVIGFVGMIIGIPV